MTSRINLALLVSIVLPLSLMGEPPPDHRVLQWKQIPPLPDTYGFAGMFAGTSNGALIVAGGANFPQMPTPVVSTIGTLLSPTGHGPLLATSALTPNREIFDYSPFSLDGAKLYYDDIYVLTDSPNAKWQKVTQKLPARLAYGISATHGERLICAGGNNATSHSDRVFALRWTGERIEIDSLPSLPKPCSQSCGAVVKEKLYIAGGLESPASTEAMKTFWSLDLSNPKEWESLSPWPGAERFQSVAGAQDNTFFLFGGIRLKDHQGKAERILPYLTDCYSYKPDRKSGNPWQKLTSMPRAAAAAPSPAIPLGQAHLVVVGGADGARMRVPHREHPGFKEDVQVYHTITNTWSRRGTVPKSGARVTAPVAPWKDGFVIVSGEASPKVRSPIVYYVEQAPRASSFGLINWIVVGVYLLALMGMGFYFSLRGESTEDFFLAGQRIPWWAAGLSIYGTQLSAITFMAIPATAYLTDWSRVLGNGAILLIAPLVILLYLPFFRRLKVVSAYEYLERRFSVAVRVMGSLTFILYHFGRMGIILLLPAVALATVTGMDVRLCIAVMGVVCIIYTVMGGIEAVIWTDVIQVFVLVLGALFCLFLIAGEIGGIGEILSRGAADNKTKVFQWGWSPMEAVVWVILLGQVLFNLIPYTSDQTVVQRYLTTPTERQAANGIWVNALLALPTAFLFFGLGTALFYFFQTRPELLTPGPNDAILPEFIVQQMPVGLAGLVIAGVFAASMSSIDSSMNSIATAGVTDFYRRFVSDVSENHALKVAKVLTVITGVVGTAMALWMSSWESRSLFDQFIQVMSMLGGGLAGVMLLGIMTRRANSVGAIIGLISGATITLVVKLATPLSFFLYAGVGITSCVIIGYVASLILPGRAQEEGLTCWSIPPKEQMHV